MILYDGFNSQPVMPCGWLLCPYHSYPLSIAYRHQNSLALNPPRPIPSGHQIQLGWGRFFKNRYDLHFPKEIRFARHAMAIDEYRKDFARVKWGGSSLPPNRPGEPDVFEQIWFAGNHADIGGSYPETESRLSDVACNGWWISLQRRCAKRRA